ncbi:MAG: TonB-dependent receptor [Bryobacteraceae bacterium]|nr:TonB-dependent receptor [Bryobacteraceae bacterium]
MRFARRGCVLALLGLLMMFPARSFGQTAAGSVAGLITDESGAVIPGATIRVVNKQTGAARTLTSAADGVFRAELLQAGEYEIRVEAQGFRSAVRAATVATGATTSADFRMQVGAAAETVTVEGAAAQISYDSNKIDGVVTRKQIQDLPLNGRSFLQLAFLEPGVTVSTGSTSQYNSQFSVSVLGANDRRTAIAVDGGNIRNPIEGQSSQNFSQEVVQEFQLSSVNFDLSTGNSATGAVNIVTRTGSNDFHGSGYFFFRDQNMAGYPALVRDPRNPEPPFARRQSGFWVGGPMWKDRAFFFFNMEHNNQDSVVTFQPNQPSVQPLAQNATSPYTGTQLSPRWDFRINDKHNMFLRYSQDRNKAFGPAGGAQDPTNWLVNTNWALQSMLGVTSTLSSTLVNDARFQFAYWNNRNLFPEASDCPSCIALDLPQISIAGTNVVLGHTQNATQGRDIRTYQLVDNMTWQKGAHRMKFGGEWQLTDISGFWGFCDPACVTVYSPELVRSLTPSIQVPSVIRSLNDVLQLPVLGVNVGFGAPDQPQPFQLDRARYNHRFHFYWQDSWRIKPRFTLNYGLGWQAETNLANHDLDKPAYLAPIVGGGDNLKPTKRDWNNFSPAIGFAWQLDKSAKTVLRAGSGIFYDSNFLWQRLNERTLLGPRGNGRQNIAGAFIPNFQSGIPGVAVGRPLDFQNVPTEFRLGNFMNQLGQIGSFLGQQFAPNFSDLSIRGIDLAKSASGFSTIFPRDYPVMYGLHYNIGVQRELMKDLVVTADFVMRQFNRLNYLDFGVAPDANRFQSARGPVIPQCVGAQSQDPRAQCSTGPIQYRIPGARSLYRGLLIKADKRFSRRHQFTISYALQDRVSVDGIINKENWMETYSTAGPRHVLNISGIVDLPWGFQFSFISAMASRSPVTATISNIDLDGDGTNASPLPGIAWNRLNRDAGVQDLRQAVADFNTNFAGRRTPRNQLIPEIRLPENFDLGDFFSSQDIRVTKFFTFRERYRIALFAEAFNVFNIANLQGFNYNVNGNRVGFRPDGVTPIVLNPAFGQPTQRAGQVFGSGGPRAFQLAARFNF